MTIYKQCRVCQVTQPSTQFYKRARSKDGLQSTCKKCMNKASYNSRRKTYGDPVKTLKRKQRQLQRKYGLTAEEYDGLLDVADGRCPICRKETRKLVVDHDHTTGKVRGLICAGCNTGLGFFEDSVDSLTNAILYLERQDSRSSSIWGQPASQFSEMGLPFGGKVE